MKEAEERFNDYDRDNDGTITIDEFVTSYLQDEEFCDQQVQGLEKDVKEMERVRRNMARDMDEARVGFVVQGNRKQKRKTSTG